MKKIPKVLALVLAVTLIFSLLLVGCGNKPADESKKDISVSQSQQTASQDITQKLDPVNLTWYYPGSYPQNDQDAVFAKNHDAVLHYESIGQAAELSVPSIDHFAPLLYILGASDADDAISSLNDECTLGSMCMASYLFTPKEEC